jgi:fructokinase
MQIVSIGEVLWDVFGAEEYLGGAPLNFAANAQRLGNLVTLLTAVGTDARGAKALMQMRGLGLTTGMVQTVAECPTGTAITTTDSEGNASFVIERPAAFDCLKIDNAVLSRFESIRPDWIYCGTLALTNSASEEMLQQLLQRLPQAKLFYDMNLRTGHWDLPLVKRISALATVLKLNEAEAERLFAMTFGARIFNLEEFCAYWSAAYRLKMICVTLGDKGCAIYSQGKLRAFPGFCIKVKDTVGAGDAFAAAFLHGLNLNHSMEQTAVFANALGALVASRAGATPEWTVEECLELIESGQKESAQVGPAGLPGQRTAQKSLAEGIVEESGPTHRVSPQTQRPRQPRI